VYAAGVRNKGGGVPENYEFSASLAVAGISFLGHNILLRRIFQNDAFL